MRARFSSDLVRLLISRLKVRFLPRSPTPLFSVLVHRGGACWGTTRAQLVDHEGEGLHKVLDICPVVNIHREVHSLVAQNIGDHFRVNSRAAQLRRERVAKIVPPAKRDSKFLSSRSDVALTALLARLRLPPFRGHTPSARR